MALRCAQILREPTDHVRPQPADTTAVKATFAWEAAEQGETQHHPARSAGQACHVVGGEKLFPIGESLVDEWRETDAISSSRDNRRWRIFRIHKRPSCVVPVV